MTGTILGVNGQYRLGVIQTLQPTPIPKTVRCWPTSLQGDLWEYPTFLLAAPRESSLDQH